MKRELKMSRKIDKARFGDIVENGWVSKDNLRRTGIFIKKNKSTITLTDGEGCFWDIVNDASSKSKVVGSIYQQLEVKLAKTKSILKVYEEAVGAITGDWICGEYHGELKKYKGMTEEEIAVQTQQKVKELLGSEG